MATNKSATQAKYDKAHCRSYTLKLNNETDKDIISQLAAVPNMQAYIKQAIRAYMACTTSNTEKEV